MAAQVTNYQCPACTGPMHFEGDSGKLACDYCGSRFTVEEVEAFYAEHDQQAAEAFEEASAQPAADSGDWDDSHQSSDWGDAALKTYNCPSCGAELICEETTAATSCPYCGNPSIIPGQFHGALKPDFVIPFKLDKQQALAALKQHYRGKRFLPKSFSDENHVQEIKGVYVPFWLFDGEVDADVSFHATQVSAMPVGNQLVTTTRHYNVRRAGTVPFEKIPVDASKKMPDAYMDAIEPFDYSELKPFSTAYLPGFFADVHDVSVDECSNRADGRAKKTALESMHRSVGGYSSCTVTSQHATLRRGAVHYALLPVWMLSTRWNGKNYLFAMNGQSGKMVSDLPVSQKRFWATWCGITAGLTALFAVIAGLLTAL